MRELKLVRSATGWLRTPRKFARAAATIPLFGVLILTLVLTFGLPEPPVQANNCQVGSSSTCPATSPQEIFNLYGTSTNGVYWLRVDGTAREVQIVMDTSAAWGSGYWVMLMKGERGSSSFGYSSTAFTSNTSVFGTNSTTRDFLTSAKFHAYNSLPLTEILAVLAQPERGSIASMGDIQSNNFGGHTWRETGLGGQTAFARLSTSLSLNSPQDLNFSSVPVSKYRQSSSGASTQVFSYQTGTGLYGLSQECAASGYKVRWGILWNNETRQLGSCDAAVGIGMQASGADVSARDVVSYNDSLTFPAPSAGNSAGLGQLAFQIWGKMASPSLVAPSAPSIANSARGSVNVSWAASSGATEYVLQYKRSSDAWSTSPTQSFVVSGTSVAVSGLENDVSYDFRVAARSSSNSSTPSTATTHTIVTRTISFGGNGATSGSMANQLVANAVATTLSPNAYQRTGYTFLGWSTNSSAITPTFTDGQSVAFTSNASLSAVWQPNVNVVTFNPNGGTGSATNQSVTTDVTTSLLANTFSRDGFVFSGWNTLANGTGAAFSNQQSIVLSSSLTLFAQWNSVEDRALGLQLASLEAGDYVGTSSSIVPAGEFSIEAWVRPTSFVESPAVFAQGDSGSTTMQLSFTSTGRLRVGISGNFYAELTQPAIPLDAWTHIALTKDAQNIPRIYVNSVHVWTGTSAVGSYSGQFRIGEWHLSAAHDFAGNVDQVKVWSTALTSSAFATSMHTYSNSGVAGTLEAHYDFNDPTGTIELDRSGKGRHLSRIQLSSGSIAGGTILETGIAYGTQTYVKFNRTYLTALGGWTAPTGVARYKALALAGGGGGGAWVGGGGGAGGYTESPRIDLSASSAIPIRVGQGGTGALKSTSAIATYTWLASNGQESSIGSVRTVSGGGRGGSWNGSSTGNDPASGGSGGGGVGGSARTDGTGAAGIQGQGFGGGSGNSSVFYPSGGGGGAGGVGGSGTATPKASGAGGLGVTTFILGPSGLQLAGGGGGGGHDSNDVPGSASHGGGAGAANTSTQAGSGQPNTGGGGGGSGGASQTFASFGGNGGSGVVILSYGPYLEVTRSPIVARVGSAFDQPIQIQLTNLDGTLFSSNSPVTVTASANVLQINGQALTQSLTVNAVNGIATFTGLGFQAGVMSNQTLTFTSDAFVGATISIAPMFMPTNVNVATGVTTGGVFHQGLFYATASSGTTNILTGDLATHLQSFSTVISASGFINVANGFAVSSTASDITLRAGSYISVTAGQTIRTAGGDIVLWADSDSTSGGYVRLLDAATLCTVSTSCLNTTSGGGDIVIGGGLPDANNPNRPGGTAAGTGNTYSTGGASDNTGVQLGSLGNAGTGAKIWSAGGNISIRGRMVSGAGGTWAGGVAVVSGADIRSGTGKIALYGETAGPVAGSDGNIEFAAWGGAFSTTIESLSTASDAILVEGNNTTADTSEYGIFGANDTLFSTPGGLTFRSDMIASSFDPDISVSGQVVIESYTTRGVIDTYGGAKFTFSIGTADDFNFTRPPSALRIGSASNSKEVEFSGNFSSSGAIDIIAEDIDILNGSRLRTTDAGARITLRARDWIDVNDGNSTTFTTIQTNNGDIIFWTNAQNGGSGYVLLGLYATVNSANGDVSKTRSGGGRITLAGGSATDASGHPTGPVPSSAVANRTWAVWLEDFSKLYSGGGRVFINATSTQAVVGALFEPNSLIWSGTGQIAVSVSHLASNHAVRLNASSWVSAATASPAIELSTRTSGAYYGIYNDASNRFSIASIADSGGGVSVSATTPLATTQTLYMWGWDILSRAGDIRITTNGLANWNSGEERNLGAKSGSDVPTSSANISLISSGVYDQSANTLSKISTSGAVRFAPFGANFTIAYEVRFDIQAGSFEFGNIANVNTASSALTLHFDVNTQNGITISAQSLTGKANADLTATAPGARIFLKVKDGYNVESGSGTSDATHSRWQTNMGDLVVWADADGDGTGSMIFGYYLQFNTANGSTSSGAVSGGGDIVFGGGTTSDAVGFPTGYVGSAGDRSFQLADWTGVYSGGGDIRIRARTNSSFGVILYQSVEIFSGTGTIDIEGVSTGAGSTYGVAFIDPGGWPGHNAGPLTFVSASTASPAVKVRGTTAGSGQGVRLWGSNAANILTLASTSTTGGGIDVYGQAASDWDVLFMRTSLLSRTGPITASSNVNTFAMDYAYSPYNNFGSVAGNAYVSTSSANVTILMNLWDFDDPNTFFRTTGDVSILPKTNNFFGMNAAFAFSTDGVRNLTIGKDPQSLDTSRTITLTGNHTVSGNVRVYGGIVQPQGHFAATGNGDLLFEALQDVNTDNNVRNFTTQGGDITFWADSDATGGGSIFIAGASRFSSNGGDITFAGGLDNGSSAALGTRSPGDSRPDGYAIGRSGVNDNAGVKFGTNSTVQNIQVLSGGGDIYVAGQAANIGTTSRYGVMFVSGVFDAGAGKIRVKGVLDSLGSNSYQRAVLFGYAGGNLAMLSSNSASDAIHIHGDSSMSSGGLCLGIQSYDNQDLIIANEGSGGVTLIGDGCNSTTNDGYTYPDGIALSDTAVVARSGTIRIEATTRNTDNTAWGLFLNRRNQSGNDAVYLGAANRSYTLSTGRTVSITTSSANVDLLVNSIRANPTPISTSGKVSIRSRVGFTFSSSPLLTNISLNNAVSEFEVGHPGAGSTQNLVDVTLDRAYSISGPISVYANNITVNEDQNVISGSGAISLKARGAIQTGNNVDFGTQNGDVTLWSDADNDGSGVIRFGTTNTVLTRGGDLTIAGGLDDAGASSGITGRTASDGKPDGFATDTSNTIYRAGVELQTGRNFNTAGGDIFIAARGGGNQGDRYGMFSAQGVTDAGAGQISIWAALRSGTSGDYNFAWFAAYDTTNIWSYVQGGTDQWISSATNTDAISVNVNSSNGSGQFNSALNAELPAASSGFAPGLRVVSLGVGGEIKIRATGGSNNAARNDGMGAPVHLQYAEILSRNGQITIESTISATAPSHAGISLADTAGDNADATWNSSDRVYLGASPVSNSPITTSSAQIVLRSNSLDFSDGVSEVRKVIVSTSGTLTLEPMTTSFRSELTTRGLDPRVGNLVVGKSGNTATVTVHASHPVSISGTTTVFAGNFNQAGSVTSSAGVIVNSDDIAIAASLASRDGSVTIRPQTLNRPIDLGTNTANRLGLVQSELSFIETPRLRFGSTTTGDIFVTQNVSLSSSKVTSVRLSTPGAVTSTGSILTAQNLAIDAGGGVNLPGSNSVSGAVAISASSMVTYSSAVSYSPSAVDGVTPVFGVGTAISQTNSPTTEEANEFLAVAFNPPPQFAIRDAYSKVLDANNRLAYSYTLSASVASGSGTVTGLTSSSRVGGVVSFNNLRVTSGVGVYAFTISATLDSTTLETRSANYNVMAGEPGQLEVIASTTSAPAGKTGLGFTVIVRDAYGNAITAGDHKNISVSASISDTTAALVSGGEVRANDAGIATFSNLVVSGSVSDTIGITFKVTYTSLANALTTVTSSETIITLTPGDASKVLINTAAAGAGSGVAFTTQPQISVVDAYGNTVKGVAYSISASVSAGVSISPATATANTVSGIATLVGSSISGTVGNYSISYRVTSAGGNAIQSAEQSIALSWGNASRLSVSATALTATNRVTLNQLTVNVLDASGNTVGDGSQLIQATVSSALLTGTTQVFASGGVATFNNALTISGQVGTHTLVFSASGVAAASVTVTLNHGVAASVDLTVSATAKNAQSFATQPQVRILDADGNLVTTGSQSTQTVELIVSPGALTGATAISASGGIATFTGVALNGTIGSHTLTGRLYTPATLSDNETITLGFGDATKLTLETAGVGAASGIALTTQPILKLRDSSNNEVTGVAHNVIATIDPAASLSGTTVAVNTSTATATFTALSISGIVGSYTISYSIEGASSSAVASVSQAIQLTHGVATNIRMVSQPTSGVAGSTLSAFVVEVIDARGNRVTTGDTSSKTITVTNARPYTTVFGTKSVSLSSGLATFDNLAVDLAESNQYFRIEVTGIPGINSANFSVTGGAPYKLGFTGTPPANRKAGETQAGDAFVRVYDQFNNFATLTSDITTAVTVVLSSDQSSVSKTISANLVITSASGTAMVTRSSQTMTKVGNFQFKATAPGLEAGYSNTFTISNAVANKLAVVQDVASSMRSGLTFSPAVRLQVQDQYGNPVLDSVTTVSTAIVSGSAMSIVGATASNTLGSSFIDLPNLAIEGPAGTKRLRFSASSNSAAAVISSIDSQAFNLTFGEAVKLSASATVASIANRTALPNITISVLDSAGNILTDNQAQIQVTVSGIVLSGTDTRFATSGQTTFTALTLSGTIGTYNLGFTSTGLTGATVSVTVTHGAANHITMTSPATAKNHISLGSNAVVVRIIDADNNLVTSGAQSTQTVQLNSQGAVSSGTTAVSASGGIATFSNVVLTGLVGTKTLSATIQLPTQISTSSAIELQPGNPYRLELTQAASGFSNREVFGTAPIVTVEDVSGNTVPTAGMDIRVKVSTASISGSITASAQTGVATFASNLVLRGTAGSHTLIYEAEGTSSSGVISTSQVITLNHGAASQLVITTAIANALSGVDFGTQPTVELRDPEGNRVSTSNQATATVEVSYSGAVWDAQTKQGVTLTGTRAISLSAGIGQFSGLRLSGVAGNYALSFSFVSQPAISVNGAVTLEPGNATGINVVQQPQNVVAGARFAQSVSAEIIDDYYNRVTRVTSSATLVANLKSATNSALISTSPEFTAQNGLVIFNGLTFESAGSRFIQFASGGSSSLPNLSAITSTTFVITHAAPSALQWVTQPATSVANDAVIAGQGAAYPELRALDRFGNLVNTGTVSYTAEVTSTSAPQSFTGVNTDGLQGVGTFQNLKLKATVGSYTIRFKANTDTNASYFASISHTIEVLHGVPTQVVATAHPAAVRAGVNFATQPVIQIRDSAGNRVSSSNAVVSITATGADLTGQTQSTAVSGIASFTSVQLSGSISGAVTLNYAISYQSQTISTSESVNLTPGLADYMVLDWTAADIQTRAAIAPAPVVRLYDQFGNLVTLDNATQVTAKLFRLGSLVTTSTQVFTASGGVVNFTGLTFIAQPNQGYSLKFESTGLTAVSSSAVTVLPGPVDRVEIVTEPGTGAGVTQTRTGDAIATQPRIKLVDFDGNIVTTVNSGSVTAALASGADGQVISASVSVSAGIAQFVNLGLIGKVATPTQSAEIYRLAFSYNGITSSPSAQLTLKHNVANKIVQIQDAVGGPAGLNFLTQPKVKVVDRFGNTVFDDSAVTVLAVPEVASGAGGVSVAGSNEAITDANGIATFNMGLAGLTSNTYKLVFKDDQEALVPASQSGIVITYGQARQLYIARAASATDSNSVRTKTGEALEVQPVIEVRDDWGNRVLNSSHTITVSLSSTVRGARDYLRGFTVSAVAGLATFSNLALTVQPEATYQLTYKFSGNATALTQPGSVWVTHADAEYITIERQPQGGNKTGNSLSLSPVVTVRDFDGNPTTMLVGQTVSASITQGAGSITFNGQASLVGGFATFSNVTIVALPGENQRLTFTLNGYQNSASQTVTSVQSNEISVTFNDPHKLALIQQPSANAVTADLLAVQPKVVIQDFYGNTVSNYVGTVFVQSQNGSRLVGSSDETLSSLSALVVNGVAEFSSIRIEGPANSGYTLDFNSGALQSTTSNAVVLTHTAPHSLRIVTQPVGAVTGQLLANQPSVEILDRFGNVANTNNSSQVTVSVFSGPNRPGGAAAQISGSTTVTATNGLVTFSGLKFTGLVNSDYIFRFATSGIVVNSNPVRVTSAGAASFEWVQLPQVDRTGELMPTPAALKVLDFDGNLAVSSSDTVTVTVTGGGYIESGTTSQVVNGYVTFSNLILVAPPSVSQQLTFTATAGQTSFAISTQQNLQVRHTGASEARVNRSPNQIGQQGAAFTTQPKIFLYDRYGNKAIYDNSTVVTATIASGNGGAVSGSSFVTAVGGEANFASLALTGSPGVAYTLKYSVGNSYHVVDSTVLRVFKTAEINVAYPTVNFSLSATVAPTVATTDSTENPLVFTSTTTQFCTVNSSTGVATIVAAGTCVIRVSVADGTYYKQRVLDVNLVIQKAAQTPLVMTSPNFVDYGQVLTLTHSGGSSTAAPEYFATGTCRAFGNQLMMFGDATEDTTASCTVRVIQDGDSNFEGTLSPGQRITVRKIAQAPLSIGNARQTSVGDVDLFTVGGSGPGTVSYQVSAGVGTATCSIVDGNKLRATTNGWCEVSAQKNASVNYNTASSPVVVFTFSKQAQVVTFTSATPGMLLPGQSYQLSAGASSGLSVSFAVSRGLEVQASAQTSYSPAICSLSQNTVTLLGTGTCEITATQAGNSQFASATAKLVLTVGQLNQVITFAQPEDMVYGTPTARLTAQASSGLPVRYTTSAGVSACTVSTDGLLTLTSAGDCSVIANQPGDGRYAAAAPVTRIFTVTPDQASSPALVSAAVGNQWFTVGYTQPSYTGGSNIIGYRLEVTDLGTGDRYVNSACSTTAPLSCTMVGIPNSRTYSARVAAITAAGVGRYSSATAALVPTNAEISVTQLKAGISGADLVMQWTPPAAVAGTFLRYDIYVWPQGSTPPSTPTTTVSTLSATSTAVPVATMTSSGNITQSSNVSQPVFVNAFQVRSRVLVFGAINQGPVGFIRLASSQSQVATASNLVGYEMRVVTVTDQYASAQTINTAMGVKLGLSTPDAPTQLTLDTTDPTKIIASWGAPNFDGGFPIDDYEVRSNGQVICANIQVRMCEISPLTQSTLYRIEVRARNAAGMGAVASAQHTTPTPPAVTLNSGTELLVRLPAMQNFIPKIARPGQIVEVGGTKLNVINELRLGGVKIDFTAVSATELRFKVPVDTKPGTYNIEHYSEFGKVTVIDALNVVLPPVTESPVTESPNTQSPVTESPEPTDTDSPEVPGDSGSGSNGSGSSGSNGSGSSGGSSGGSTSGGESNGGSVSNGPDTDSTESPDSGSGSGPDSEQTDSEVALPETPQDRSFTLVWLLLLAIMLAAFSYWMLSRRQSDSD